MSQHFINLNAIENERIALIDRFSGTLEATIDRMVADRVAQAMAQLPRFTAPPPAPRAPVAKPPRLRERRARPGARAREGTLR